MSILLAMTGMFGVTAYTVTQRQFEFALSVALGAQRLSGARDGDGPSCWLWRRLAWLAEWG